MLLVGMLGGYIVYIFNGFRCYFGSIVCNLLWWIGLLFR